jgi:ABC-type transport system substrate-binding protein
LLEESGIKVNLVGEEFGTCFADRSARKFEISVGGGLPYASEKFPIQFMYITDWTRKETPIREPLPEIDPIIDQVMATPDINERQKLVLDATRKMLDRHGPFFYLYAPYTYTARWNYVHGYENVPSQKWPWVYDMWLDK